MVGVAVGVEVAVKDVLLDTPNSPGYAGNMPTPAQLGSDTGPGDKLGGTPEQNPEATEGGAPAGPWFGNDLPSVSVVGGKPATLDGYTPSREQDKLPRPGSDEGCGTAPTGIRR